MAHVAAGGAQKHQPTSKEPNNLVLTSQQSSSKKLIYAHRFLVILV
jgi:hypothetical protein